MSESEIQKTWQQGSMDFGNVVWCTNDSLIESFRPLKDFVLWLRIIGSCPAWQV